MLTKAMPRESPQLKCHKWENSLRMNSSKHTWPRLTWLESTQPNFYGFKVLIVQSLFLRSVPKNNMCRLKIPTLGWGPNVEKSQHSLRWRVAKLSLSEKPEKAGLSKQAHNKSQHRQHSPRRPTHDSPAAVLVSMWVERPTLIANCTLSTNM